MKTPSPAPPYGVLWKYDLGLVLAVVVLYREVVFGGARVIGRDVLHYLIPIGAALRDGFVGNGSLLWDGGVDHGLPVLARWSPMVFYPGQWLHAVLPPVTAISVGIILHLVLAGCATMRLALRFTTSIPAAWVAGFSYACGGYLISVSVAGGYLFGAALLPLSLLSLHRLAERPVVVRMAQTAAVLTLQIFCADPQTLFYEALFVAPLIVFLHRREAGTLARRVGVTAGAGVIAAGLSACQWLPALEFSALSVRAGGLSPDASAAWAFHPLRLAQFLSPHVFGAVAPQNTFWARSLVNASFWIPWAPLVYIGLLPWAGIIAAPWRRARALAAVGGLTLFFLLLAFGPWAPVFGLVMRALPGATLFRYPEKFLVFVTLGLCLLGSAGLGRLVEGLSSVEPGARRRRFLWGGGFFLLAATAAGLRSWLDPASPLRIEWFAGVLVGQHAQDLSPSLALATTAASLGHTAAIATVIAAVFVVGHRLKPNLLTLVIVLIAVADVLPQSASLLYLADASGYAGTPATCQSLPAPAFGLPPLVWRYQEQFLEFENDGDEDTVFGRLRKWEWDTLKANTGSMYCLRHADGYEAARLSSYRLLWNGMGDDLERRLRLFGVQYVIAVQGTLDRERFPVVLASEELGTMVHRVPGSLPYAHSVGTAERVSNVQGAVARLVDTSFDINRVVVLERSTAPVDYGEAARRAMVRSYRPGEIIVDVDSAAAGYLMLQETYYPGWRAEAVSKAILVERANAHFIGVEVPAGAYSVRFVFDPPVQRRATLIALATAGLFLCVVGAALVARRTEVGSHTAS